MTLITSPYVLPKILLVCSNVFMTFAWYGHLKFAAAPLWAAVLTSWSIALSNIGSPCPPTALATSLFGS